MDLSKLSDEDLEALASRDMTRMSDSALRALSGEKESPAFKEGRKSSLRGLYSVLQGPTFGFADEIAGAIGGVAKALMGEGSFKQNYENIRDTWRGGAKREEEERPWVTPILRGMASAPTMMLGGGGAAPVVAGMSPARAALNTAMHTANTLGGRVQPAVGLGANAARAGVLGAATGAASGLGQSEADSLGGMALDTVKGGALGGALGAGGTVFARGMGKVGEVTAPMFSQSAADRYAREKVAEALLRDARGTVAQQSPEAALQQALARVQKLGPEARVADAAGQNTRQLLDTLATLPGRSKEAVNAAILSRQAGRADRLQQAAQQGLNPSGARLQDTVEQLIEQRAADARPLYENLYKTGVFVNDELRNLIERAKQLGAAAEGRKIATAKGVPYSLDRNPQWAGMRELDYLKQGLDDIIAASKDQTTGKLTKVGASVQGLKQDLVSLLDDATSGAYRKAREAFAGPSELIDAARAGSQVWSQTDTAIGKALAGMTQGEQEAFKLGASEALRAKLGNMGGQTEILKMWRDKTTREKLQAIFGDERSFRQFASTAAAEARMKGLESVGRGSQTASRHYGAGDVDVPAIAGAALTAANSGSLPALISGASNLWNKVRTPEPVRDRMGSMLLMQGQDASYAMRNLMDAMNRVGTERTRNAGLLGIGSGNLLAPELTGLLGR